MDTLNCWSLPIVYMLYDDYTVSRFNTFRFRISELLHIYKKLNPYHVNFYDLQVKQLNNQIPVNARALDDSVLNETREEPTSKPVTDRLASWKKTVDTPTKQVDDPTQLPLSERFAGKSLRFSIVVNTLNQFNLTTIAKFFGTANL